MPYWTENPQHILELLNIYQHLLDLSNEVLYWLLYTSVCQTVANLKSIKVFKATFFAILGCEPLLIVSHAFVPDLQICRPLVTGILRGYPLMMSEFKDREEVCEIRTLVIKGQ